MGPELVSVFNGFEKDTGQDKDTREEASGHDEPLKTGSLGKVWAMPPAPQPHTVPGTIIWANGDKGPDRELFCPKQFCSPYCFSTTVGIQNNRL